MKLSILILNYNSRGLLKQAVRSIDAAHLSVPYEVIIVDNASADGSVEMVEHDLPHVRLVKSPKNLGYGGGNNLGVTHAHGEYLLIINPDVTVLPGSVEALVNVLDRNQDTALCVPQLLHPDKSIQYSCYRFPAWYTPILRRTWLGKTPWGKHHIDWFLMADWDHTEVRPIDWAIGGAMLVRKQEMEDVGGFDLRYFLYFEDIDLCRQLWEKGKRVMYIPHSQMVHFHKRESAKDTGIKALTNRMTRIHIQSAWKYFRKWRKKPLPLTK